MAVQVLEGGYAPSDVRRILPTQVQDALEMVRTGVFTINEVRKNFGYQPIGWGDQMATITASAQ